jgi:hypothetical protein
MSLLISGMFLDKLKEQMSGFHAILVKSIVHARKNKPKLVLLRILFSIAPSFFYLLPCYVKNV